MHREGTIVPSPPDRDWLLRFDRMRYDGLVVSSVSDQRSLDRPHDATLCVVLFCDAITLKASCIMIRDGVPTHSGQR